MKLKKGIWTVQCAGDGDGEGAGDGCGSKFGVSDYKVASGVGGSGAAALLGAFICLFLLTAGYFTFLSRMCVVILLALFMPTLALYTKRT